MEVRRIIHHWGLNQIHLTLPAIVTGTQLHRGGENVFILTTGVLYTRSE